MDRLQQILNGVSSDIIFNADYPVNLSTLNVSLCLKKEHVMYFRKSKDEDYSFVLCSHDWEWQEVARNKSLRCFKNLSIT